MADSRPKDDGEPHVIVVGAGPSGILVSLILSQRHGVRTTVLERSDRPEDRWSTKSYSINLQHRGRTALATAPVGALDAVLGVATERRGVVVEEFDDDGTKRRTVIPRDPPNAALSRPELVGCLEGILSRSVMESRRAVVRRGVGVAGLSVEKDGGGVITGVRVRLEDGNDIFGTHVVGADGKWSAVRSSTPSLARQFRIRTEPSWGVMMLRTSVPPQWSDDVTTIFRPRRNDAGFYALASPLPSGECCVPLVCFDEVLQRYPFLRPPESDAAATGAMDEEIKGSDDGERAGNGMGWKAENSARTQDMGVDEELAFKLKEMLELEMPEFLQALGLGTLRTAKINRRTSWLEPVITAESVQYCTDDGRIVLIGDAAHAMTPSIAEGCNMALESAVESCKSLPEGRRLLSTDDISDAFRKYGRERPNQAIPVQMASARGSRLKKEKVNSALGGALLNQLSSKKDSEWAPVV